MWLSVAKKHYGRTFQLRMENDIHVGKKSIFDSTILEGPLLSVMRAYDQKSYTVG